MCPIDSVSSWSEVRTSSPEVAGQGPKSVRIFLGSCLDPFQERRQEDRHQEELGFGGGESLGPHSRCTSTCMVVAGGCSSETRHSSSLA